MVKIKIALPDCFYDEENRNGFIVDKKRKEIWAVELDLLAEFDRVCKQLGVNYFLDGGTLLGAVREKGFIPWDDDIDVIMMRKDYDILMEKGPSLFRSPIFFQSAYTDKNYFRGHAQLRNSDTAGMLINEAYKVPFNQGIFLDIFVLDGLIQDTDKLEKQFNDFIHIRRLFRYTWMPYSSNKLKEIIKRILSKILQIKYRNPQKLYKQLEKIAQRYSYSEYVDKIETRKNSGKVFYLKKSWFEKSILCEFEGFFYPIPYDYDKILSAYYGKDYMIPKNIPSTHGTTIFDTEKSYLEIIKQKNKSF